MSKRERYNRLTPEQKDQFGQSLDGAVYHMISCWDELRQIELLLGAVDPESDSSVDVDAIEYLCVDNYDIDRKQVERWLDTLDEAA